MDGLLLVCIGVGETLDLTGLSTKESVKSWSDLVTTAALDSVALGASSLEEGGTLVLENHVSIAASLGMYESCIVQCFPWSNPCCLILCRVWKVLYEVS